MKTNLRSKIKPVLLASSLALSGLIIGIPSALAAPATYELDTKGAHAFVQFKIKHLGYSWLLGQFNQFTGEFVYDKENIENSSVRAEINVGSIDSNHAERAMHLRGTDFLDTDKFPKAAFVSTNVKKTGQNTADVTGNFTLKGITKPITLKAVQIGGGPDPWGGQRQGFELTGQFALKDYGITYNLGPASEVVQIYISAEGIKKK